jgi:Icc protein
MAWAGTGLVWTMAGGIPVSRAFAKNIGRSTGKGESFSFVQISDRHIGFNKPANPDVTATLQAAINKINANVPKAGLHHSHWGSDAALQAW